MTKWLHQLKKSRKLLIALAIAGAVAVPVGVTYAQSGQTEPVIAEQQEVKGDETLVTPVVAEEVVPVVTVNEQTPPTEQTPTPTPAPDPAEVAVAVTFEQAQVIAEAEHTGSTVVVTKTVTKVLEGKTVFTFIFADGWKVSVRAEDGTVIKVVDPSNKMHDCQNKFKKDADAAKQNWNNGNSERKDRENRSEHHNSGRNSSENNRN